MDSGVIKFYEQDALRKVSGGSIHPGGLALTQHAIELCALPKHARILDIACGTGASVQWLKENHEFQVTGFDASELMLQTGQQRCSDLPLACGESHCLPIARGQLDAILVECSLSLMPDLDCVLAEFSRVLTPSGRLIVSDVYLRNPKEAELLQSLPLEICLKGAKSQVAWLELLHRRGFQILVWEDHSQSLKPFMAQFISANGSIQEFWCKSMPCEINFFDLQVALARTKPGYFLLIAGKNE
ncbi:MAG: methyltransferase domain-containing protein [Anaerolineales bacterium]|nr:methyltransferase domain-containing protein [Anaerolineales bacterium]